jgi:hypothetical protein
MAHGITAETPLDRLCEALSLSLSLYLSICLCLSAACRLPVLSLAPLCESPLPTAQLSGAHCFRIHRELTIARVLLTARTSLPIISLSNFFFIVFSGFCLTRLDDFLIWTHWRSELATEEMQRTKHDGLQFQTCFVHHHILTFIAQLLMIISALFAWLTICLSNLIKANYNSSLNY